MGQNEPLLLIPNSTVHFFIPKDWHDVCNYTALSESLGYVLFTLMIIF